MEAICVDCVMLRQIRRNTKDIIYVIRGTQPRLADQFVDRSLRSATKSETIHRLKKKASIPDKRRDSCASNTSFNMTRSRIKIYKIYGVATFRETDEFDFDPQSFVRPSLSSFLSYPIARLMTSTYSAAHRGFYFYILHVQITRE